MGDILESYMILMLNVMLNECGMLICNVLQILDAFAMSFQRWFYNATLMQHSQCCNSMYFWDIQRLFALTYSPYNS